jgi:hypothetical protein
MTDQRPEPGQDTPTGTDPDAKYEHPGYEDKSFGQAVEQDQAAAERILADTGGDVNEAEARFRRESAGAPAANRQRDAETNHTTGEADAARNRAEDPPA